MEMQNELTNGIKTPETADFKPLISLVLQNRGHMPVLFNFDRFYKNHLNKYLYFA